MIKYIVVKKFLPGLDSKPLSNIFRNLSQSEIFPEFSFQLQRMGPQPPSLYLDIRRLVSQLVHDVATNLERRMKKMADGESSR